MKLCSKQIINMDVLERLKHRKLIESSPLSDELWDIIYSYSSQEDYENMKLSSSQLYYVQSNFLST